MIKNKTVLEEYRIIAMKTINLIIGAAVGPFTGLIWPFFVVFILNDFRKISTVVEFFILDVVIVANSCFLKFISIHILSLEEATGQVYRSFQKR